MSLLTLLPEHRKTESHNDWTTPILSQRCHILMVLSRIGGDGLCRYDAYEIHCNTTIFTRYPTGSRAAARPDATAITDGAAPLGGSAAFHELCANVAPNALGVTLPPYVSSTPASLSGAWLPSLSRRAEAWNVRARQLGGASDSARPTPFRRWATEPATPPVLPLPRRPT